LAAIETTSASHTDNPNRPLMRDWLLEVTAHREPDAFSRAIDLRVTRLHRKVEINPAHLEAIRTVRGVGYMFGLAKN
jgi:DNA-binding response OmpR family regulator